ncbi:MAG: DUF998 domain-containing protein [Methanobacteriota archaeon]
MAPSIPPRLGAASGIAAVVAWTALYLTSVALDPGYSVIENYLSDLGHPTAPGNWAFNAADLIAGILFIPFALAVGQVLRTRLGWIGSMLMVLAGLALVLVGVFPEESPNNLHVIVSAAFFLLLTASAAVLGRPLHVSPAFGRLSGYLAAATVAGSVAFLVSGGSRVLEHVAVYAGLVWAAWTAARLGTAAAAPGPSAPAPSAVPGRGPPVP